MEVPANLRFLDMTMVMMMSDIQTFAPGRMDVLGEPPAIIARWTSG
jgi:hypothetical protein